MKTTIKTINDNFLESKIEVKKSVFIAHLIYVKDEDDLKNKLDEIKNKYKDATHNVPAYRIYDKDKNMVIEKCSDDGEPQGTSGPPLLDLLKHKELLNVLLVVTRYFGGTLLGTGGLVKAYTDSAKEVISNADIIEKKLYHHYKLKCDYDTQSKLKQRLNDLNIITENISYNIDIDMDVYSEVKEQDDNINDLENSLGEFKDNIIIKYIDDIYR